MDLNIREIDDDLVKRIKIKAIAAGKTLKKYLTDVLEAALDEGPQVQCPLCGLEGSRVMFGTNARCVHCGSGFVPPDQEGA
jgi:plasmid stability protein